jgi:hypothetical protein
MGTREELEAALAKAEAELAQAASDRTKADAGVRLERARTHCRQERAALTELNRAEPVARPVERTEKSNRDAGKRSKGPAVKPRKAVRGLISGLSARHFVLARQALMLLALVLAYLQYYFFDVSLQVSRLPSITVLLVG